MKLAIINNGLSAGGRRFEASLIRGLRSVRPDWKISYFTDLEHFNEPIIQAELTQYQVSIHDYRSLDIKINTPNEAQSVPLLPNILLSTFDAIIFTWPYDFVCPQLSIPMLFIPHDFNFFYTFETPAFSRLHSDAIRNNLSEFFARAMPVVSTEFIKSEVARFFPDFASHPQVIPVAMMSHLPNVSSQKRSEILTKFKLRSPYFLYPCSSAKPYKNLGILAVAIDHLKKLGVDATIAYIGHQTGEICGDATANGVRQRFEHIETCNVRGLGFVSDEELVALMQGSEAVITSSLYEAANGPAIDAWHCGVPVAMSDLPFYTEHIKHSGVRATLFDPKNVTSVVDAMRYILNHRESVHADALYSKEQLEKTTSLESFATQYATLIERLAHG